MPLGVPCPSLALVLPLPGVVVPGGAGWGGGAGGPGLGLGGLEPLAEGLGGVGGAEAVDRIAEEGLPCRLWHAGLQGGLVGVGGGAGAHLLEGMHQKCTPSCLPAPPAHFTQRRSSCKAGADHQARWAEAWGEERSVPGVLEQRREDVDLRWWRGWRCLGERERRWRGLGVEGGYGWRGEREGEVDMGRRWRAWWRPGEREWWWRGLGVVDGYGRQGEAGSPVGPVGGGGGGLWAAVARLAASGGAEAVVAGAGGGGLVWPEGGGGGGQGAAVALVVVPGGAGAAGAGSQGVLGGTWGSGSGASGWLMRGGGVGSVGAVGGCAVRGGSRSAAVCGTGPDRSSRASQEASAGPGGLRVVPPGTGGGGVPRRTWIRHVGVWWRQRLVVWVE